MKLRLLRSTVCAAALLSFAGFAQAAPPPNDDLANAQLIPTGFSFSVIGTDQNASVESFEKVSGYPRDNEFTDTVWYAWTPSVSGTLTTGASPGGFLSVPGLIHVFKGPDTPSPSNYIGGTAPFALAPLQIPVAAGQQYFFCISDTPDQAHAFTFSGTVTGSSTPPPAALPVVTLKAKLPMIERSSEKEKLIFNLSSASTGALVLDYKLAGSAIAGTDYKRLPGKVTVPAGQTRVTVKLQPLHGTGADGTVAVRIKLLSSDAYTTGNPSSATIKILESR